MQTEELNNPTSKQEALQQMREALEGKRGQQYWRTLDEVSQTEQFKTWFEDEFPNRKSMLEVNRRDLLKFAGASLALAGLSGCRSVFLPEDKIVPYVKAPEELVAGKPLFYASAVMLAGYATGVLVEQFEGRPIKLEGNPEHPASLGALDSLGQAEILNFYDPDRAQVVLDKSDFSSWEVFSRAMNTQLAAQVGVQGRDVCVLVPTITSPTHASLLKRFRTRYPQAKFFTWEPCGRSNVEAGIAAATGQPGIPVYNFGEAKVILSLDGDFLSKADNPGALAYARQYANRRRVTGPKGTMNRVYSLESTPGLVGAIADHRYALKPSELYSASLALAQMLGVAVSGGILTGRLFADAAHIIEDLKANAGSCIVVAGEHQPAAIHQLALAMNSALGNIGKTVTVHVTPAYTSGMGSISDLCSALNGGLVEILIIDGVNAVYNAPGNLKFADCLAKAKNKIYLGSHVDETATVCDWALPAAHSLEVWSDARTFNGVATICQPIMAPLWEGRSSIEFWSGLLGEPKGGYDLVRTFWKSNGLGGSDFEGGWRKAVHDGVVPNTMMQPLSFTAISTVGLSAPTPATAAFEAIFVADPAIFDGRNANNGWLQELPRPLTKMTWDNVVTMAPADAELMKISTDDVVKVISNGVEVEGVAFTLPGHARGCVTLNLGYGRTIGGTIATVTGEHGGGFNAYTLMNSNSSQWSSVSIQNTGRTQHLGCTQGHSPLGGNRIPDNRDVIRAGTLAGYLENGAAALITGHVAMDSTEIREQNLYPEEIFEWAGEQWGMTIDMNTCIGCNACVTACQSENNISVVGKEQISKSREMHWIRIDRYFSGSDENPEVVWQPVACVHCEKAPCEPVCPVAATVHSHEGLNQMVYNRCVGTRYCSNNCPYKVRRFNYLNWTDNQAQFSTDGQPWNTRTIPGKVSTPKQSGVQLLKLMNNPDVTVRGRGVMEKCTYCVQRINEARIESKKAGRKIADGDIVTACQQTCPTQAIVFGDTADPKSPVSKLRSDPRSYLLLEELQTRPRTSHLGKLRNPNPKIKLEMATGAPH